MTCHLNSSSPGSWLFLFNAWLVYNKTFINHNLIVDKRANIVCIIEMWLNEWGRCTFLETCPRWGSREAPTVTPGKAGNFRIFYSYQITAPKLADCYLEAIGFLNGEEHLSTYLSSLWSRLSQETDQARISEMLLTVVQYFNRVYQSNSLLTLKPHKSRHVVLNFFHTFQFPIVLYILLTVLAFLHQCYSSHSSKQSWQNHMKINFKASQVWIFSIFKFLIGLLVVLQAELVCNLWGCLLDS